MLATTMMETKAAERQVGSAIIVAARYGVLGVDMQNINSESMTRISMPLMNGEC
jgi:hypothetical protein